MRPADLGAHARYKPGRLVQQPEVAHAVFYSFLREQKLSNFQKSDLGLIRSEITFSFYIIPTLRSSGIRTLSRFADISGDLC